MSLSIKIDKHLRRELEDIAHEAGVGTLTEVIRWLAERHRAASSMSDGSSRCDDGMEVFSFEEPPDVTHARVRAASVAGRAVAKPTWQNVLVEAVRELRDGGLSSREVCEAVGSSAMSLEHWEGGFQHHPDLGVSLQGLPAQSVVGKVRDLASRHGFPVRVEFSWLDKPGAMHPGKRAVLTMPGTS